MRSQLDLAFNELCGLDASVFGTYTPEGVAELADALRVSGSSLSVLSVEHNHLGKDDKNALRDAVGDRQGFVLKL